MHVSTQESAGKPHARQRRLKHSMLQIQVLESRLLLSSVPFADPQQVDAVETGAPSLIRLSDLDGDGDQDLLIASNNDNRITWLENLDGRSGFSTVHSIASDAAIVRDVIAADIDRDGDLDVVAAAHGDSTIGWHENSDGRGTFTTRRTISTEAPGAWSIVAADMDQDGDVDIVAALHSEDRIVWYQNDGRGRFESAHRVATAADGVRSIKVADVDRDGDADIVAASVYDDKVAWHENMERGQSFSEHFLSTSIDGPRDVDLADFDLDGDFDVVAASAFDGRVVWFENRGSGNFEAEQTVATGLIVPTSVRAFDVDQDGDQDVISTSLFVNQLLWFENHRNGTFGEGHVFYAETVPASLIDIGDLDDDGDPDLIAAVGDNGKIELLENNSLHRQTYFAPRAEFGPRGSVVDLNRDGWPDIMTQFGRTLTFYQNDSRGGFIEIKGPRIPAHMYVTPSSLVDLDGDADLDVVASGHIREPTVWFENDGAGILAQAQTLVDQPTHNLDDPFMGDVDRDGDLDLVTSVEGQLAWFEHADGRGTFADEPHLSGQSVWVIVGLVDVDLDGALDVIAWVIDWDDQPNDQKLVWFRNTDVGARYERMEPPLQALNHSAGTSGGSIILDLDGDQDSDLVKDGKLFENVGGRFELRESRVGRNPEFRPAAIGDFNRNGVLEFIQDSHLVELDSGLDQFEVGPVTHAVGTPFDVDRDGDLDLVASNWPEENTIWYENRSTPLVEAVRTTDQSFASSEAAGTLLRYDVSHLGSMTDSDVQLASLSLHFETGGGPLSDQSTIRSIAIYRDDGDLRFGDEDTLVHLTSDFDLLGGNTVLAWDDSHATRVSPENTASFFVLVQWNPSSAEVDYVQFAIVNEPEYPTEIRHADSALALDASQRRQVAETSARFTFDVPRAVSIHPATDILQGHSRTSFTVRFSQPVVGVDPSDFRVAGDQLGGYVSGIQGQDGFYVINVQGITGRGTFYLSLWDDNSIRSAKSGAHLGGSVRRDGDFTSQPLLVQTIHRTDSFAAPTMLPVGEHLMGPDRVVILAADGGEGRRIAPVVSNHGMNWSHGGFPTRIATDIDSDGDMDYVGRRIAWVSEGDNLPEGINWWERLPNGEYAMHQLSPTGTAAAIGDLDSDGEPDILAIDQSLQWYRNEGNGSLALVETIGDPLPTRPINSGGQMVLPTDIDGDGDLDIVGGKSGYDEGSLFWHENTDGRGTFGPRHQLIEDISIYTIVVSDLDSDGDVDIYTRGFLDVGSWTTGWNNIDGKGTFLADEDMRRSHPELPTPYLVDIDEDGDLDRAALNGIFFIPGRRMEENVGGQVQAFTAPHRDISPSDETETVLFDVQIEHLGREGDHDAALASLALRWEDDSGQISEQSLREMIREVSVYRDSGDGQFDDADVLLGNDREIELAGGIQHITINPSQTGRFVPHGVVGRFYVTVDFAPDAQLQDTDELFVTHVMGSTEFTGMQDAVFGAPLAVAGRLTEVTTTISVSSARVPGDSNRDGVFDRLDVITVLQLAKFETGAPASWNEGDWNQDGVFDRLDIVFALAGRKGE